MGFSFNERVALGMGGSARRRPVVLATFPVIEGIEGAREFFDIVFFAVLVSTLLQGTTFEWLSARLGSRRTRRRSRRRSTDPTTARRMGAEIAEFPVAASDAVAARLVRELGLPREALLQRDHPRRAGDPRGSTRIGAGDRLHVSCAKVTVAACTASAAPTLLSLLPSPPTPPRHTSCLLLLLLLPL